MKKSSFIIGAPAKPKPSASGKPQGVEPANIATSKEVENAHGIKREVGSESWVDPELSAFDPNDFRLFVGNLDHRVNDNILLDAFRRYPTMQKVRVVTDKRSGLSKGYGFVSFRKESDQRMAIKEMQGKFILDKPIKCVKSKWKDRCA